MKITYKETYADPEIELDGKPLHFCTPEQIGKLAEKLHSTFNYAIYGMFTPQTPIVLLDEVQSEDDDPTFYTYEGEI